MNKEEKKKKELSLKKCVPESGAKQRQGFASGFFPQYWLLLVALFYQGTLQRQGERKCICGYGFH